MKIISQLMCIFILSLKVYANEEILNLYQKQEKVIFNETRGEKFYRFERVNSKGDKVSCMTCHTSNPLLPGLTRANKVIEPMAKSRNSERYTDNLKIEKWFKRNCNDVYDRECTILEKGDFLKYMMTVK